MRMTITLTRDELLTAVTNYLAELGVDLSKLTMPNHTIESLFEFEVGDD